MLLFIGGAIVDFVDINEHDFNISIEALKEKLNDAKKKDSCQSFNTRSHVDNLAI